MGLGSLIAIIDYYKKDFDEMKCKSCLFLDFCSSRCITVPQNQLAVYSRLKFNI